MTEKNPGQKSSFTYYILGHTGHCQVNTTYSLTQWHVEVFCIELVLDKNFKPCKFLLAKSL